MHILSLIFGLMIVIVVVGFIVGAWVLRAILFRKARAAGWSPPPRRGGYTPDGQYQGNPDGRPDSSGYRHGHGGHGGGWGGFGGGHGGGHHGGGGDAGGGHHH